MITWNDYSSEGKPWTSFQGAVEGSDALFDADTFDGKVVISYFAEEFGGEEVGSFDTADEAKAAAEAYVPGSVRRTYGNASQKLAMDFKHAPEN